MKIIKILILTLVVGTYSYAGIAPTANTVLPSQTGNSGKYIQTDGTNVSWQSAGSGSVTSVGLSLPSIFTVSNSPVTSSGTLTGTFNTQAANIVFSGPGTGSAAAPTFRALVSADIPSLSYVSSVSGTPPINSSGGLTPAISCDVASGSQPGCLASADWTTFNSKQAAGSYITALTGDVTASGPGSVSATVAKIQGTAVSATGPTSGQVLTYNSSNTRWEPATASGGANTALSNLASVAINTNLLPASAGSIHLGGNGKEFQNLYLNANIVNSSNQAVVAIGTSTLSYTSGSASVQWNSARLIDSSAVQSIDYGVRVLKNSSGVAALNWASLTGGTNGYFLKTDGSGNATWAAAGTGTVTSVATGTGLSGGPITTTGTIVLADTAVTPASYGSASQVGTFTVDQQGRLTAAGNSSIAIAGSAITSGTVAIANGGTGQATQQAALNAIAGAVTSGSYLRGDGVNVTLSAIQAGDVPTLNQNTTGSAAKWTTARNLAGNSVDGSANVAFSNAFIVKGTADSGLSGAQFLGALGTGIVKNTTTTGTLSIAVAGDFPTLNQSTSGNAATATALAANPADCASNTYATTIAASGDLTCASITNAATTAVSTNTASTIVLRDGSGNFSAGTVSAALTGNASTSTALAANPTDCGSNTYATTIDASGNLTCASITNASTTAVSTNTASTIVLRDGSGNFSAGTISAALTGNSSTATALAANPTDCGANAFAQSIDASGNLTCATVDAGSSLASAKIWVGNASNLPTAVTPGGDISMSNAGSFTVQKLQAVAVSSSAPTTNDVLQYNGTSWTPTAVSLVAGKAADVQTFTSSGTWTKPTGFGAKSKVMVQAWGAGGSGGKGASNAPCGGGGGGTYLQTWLNLSSFAGTATITIGAGGAAQTSASTAGNNGGNTTVAALVTAYGGGGGGCNATGGSGGGGGGALGAGGNGTTTSGTGIIGGGPTITDLAATVGLTNPYDNTGFGGATGGFGSSTASSGGNSAYGGAGGGGGRDAAGSATANAGGSSVWGGAGGGGAAQSVAGGNAGTSLFGGAGSAGVIDANASSAGTQPGGASGGTEGGNSGAGGDGQVIITVVDGA